MRYKRQRNKEPTVTLINIVFLMLVFFLVAGTLAPPLDSDLELVNADELPTQAPPDALVIPSDGSLSWRGTEMASVEVYLESLDEASRTEVRIVPDRALPANTLISLGNDLKNAGAETILIVTEQGLQ